MPTLKLQAFPILLSLLPLATAAPSPAPASTPPPTNDWAGTGQIRPVNSDSIHEVLGCLTNHGQWTTDESNCGIFTGVREEANSIRLSSTTGVCGLEGVAKFSCGQGVEQRVWGTFGDQGPVRGKEMLRVGEYGVFAVRDKKGPPTPSDPPMDLSLYSGLEPGPWVWLSWKSLE